MISQKPKENSCLSSKKKKVNYISKRKIFQANMYLQLKSLFLLHKVQSNKSQVIYLIYLDFLSEE